MAGTVEIFMNSSNGIFQPYSIFENFAQFYLSVFRDHKNNATDNHRSNTLQKLPSAKSFRLPLTLRKCRNEVGFGWNFLTCKIKEKSEKDNNLVQKSFKTVRNDQTKFIRPYDNQ